MPLPNEILRGRYTAFLQRLFGIQGEPPTPQLGAEVQPVVDVAGQGAELLWLRDERLGGGGYTINATVAVNSRFRLRNPAASGIVVVPQLLTFGTDTVTAVYRLLVGTIGADLATGQTAIFRDRRISGTPTARLSFEAGASALVAGEIARIRLPVNTPGLLYSDTGLLVLGEGTALDVECMLANQAMTFGCWWRERALPPSERPA